MKFFAAILVLVALIACGTAPTPTPSGSHTWLPLRGLPTHATVLALAVDPRDATRIFASTYDTTGAYVSADAAQTWRAFGDGLDRTPTLTLEFVDNTLFASTTAGLYTLRDQKWTRIDAVPAVAVYSIARGADGTVYAATDAHGIFASADAGKTWTRMPGLDAEIILSVAASDAQTLFAGTSGRGAFVTRDAGKTWRALDPFAGEYVSLIAVDPRDGQTLFLRTRNGLYRSRDAGQSWQRLLSGIETEIVHALFFDSFSQRIYAATGGRGVFASDDEGVSWQNLAAGLPQGVAALSIVQVDAQTLLAGTQNGIYISHDAGKSWSAASDGLGAPQVHGLALDQSGALLVATEDGLFRSNVTGEFARIGSDAMRVPVLSVATAPSNPKVIYAGTFHRGVFVSDNGGASWNPAGDLFSGRLSPTGLAVDPQNEQNVFARVLFERIYKSTDGGDAWHAVWTGMPDDAEVETMSIAPSDSRQMFAGTNDGLYASHDAGESWTRRGLDDRTVFAVWVDPRDANALLAGATDGLYRSDDAGATWTPIALSQISVTAIARDAAGNLYAGTKYNGVWVSRDNAKTWVRFGLDDDSVIALVVDDARGTAGAVYAGTTRGIFRLTTR